MMPFSEPSVLGAALTRERIVGSNPHSEVGARSPSRRLVCLRKKPNELAVPEREALFLLMQRCYDGVERSRFLGDLDKKDFILLLHDPADNSLRGFSTIRMTVATVERRRVDLLFSGDTVIDPAYWGSKALHQGFTRFCLQHKLRHPARPLYWLLLSKGYKTFLLMANNFPVSFPSRSYVPREDEIRLRDDTANAWWGSAYDPSSAILSFAGQRDRVKLEVAPVDVAAGVNEDVAFFAAQNPGHCHGDELVCLAELRPIDLVRAWARAFKKALARRRGVSSRGLSSASPKALL